MAEKKPISLSPNALTVLEARYLRRDAERKIIETPEELFTRVAKGVAEAEGLFQNAHSREEWAEEFYRLMTSLDFLPNSPTLMNGGTPAGQLSACFVLPVEDTMEGIFESVKEMALVQRTGGGTGFSFSRLRPRGDPVESTGGEASGPVSFMKIFDAATENIKQGGKRRGANMGILRVDHPDILEFITAKLDGVTLHNFNISVGATDAFMEAVAKKQDYELTHPRTHQGVRRLAAQKVWDTLIDAAWRTGDPGMIFLDAINRANPTPTLGPIEATNPCGEIPLLPYESCNLGSINLAHMLRPPQDRSIVDWEKFKSTVRKAVRFLEDVIEVNQNPIPEIDRMSRANRKIGLGVMGFAEMLIQMGVSYDSPEAAQWAEKIMKTLLETALETSAQLAEERGPFLNWKGSLYEKKNIKVRNAALTAIAPTGTISIIANTSASIEPLFALAYRRSGVLSGQTLYETNPLFIEILEKNGLKSESLIQEILQKGSLRAVKGIPESLRRLFVTALEIPVEQHLKIQAAFQRFVDNSVSKTINLPTDATSDDVAKAYSQAWKMGLKGVTIFRYGSKAAQVLELGVHEEPRFYDHETRCDPEECKV